MEIAISVMFPYESLEVYKKAYQFNRELYRLLNASKFPPYIKNQLGRAGLSIMLNIAEGSAKNTNRDRKNFFTHARGSTFECSSLISFLQDEGEISEYSKNHFYNCLEEISKILFVMIRNLTLKE
ncbi:MAG: four helix bundle protein [Flavisolibacter sp.]